MMERQLEMTIGPLYVVEVSEELSTALSRRVGSSYSSPPQSLDQARRLAMLLLDAAEEPEGEGPWRRPLAGGHRYVRLVRTDPAEGAFGAGSSLSRSSGGGVPSPS